MNDYSVSIGVSKMHYQNSRARYLGKDLWLKSLLVFIRTTLAISIALFWNASKASAQYFWNHNGSVVMLSSNGALREIRYSTPRPGLPVLPDTLLFAGVATGNQYQGTAYVFSSVCGAVGYNVAGNVDLSQRAITLRGWAPRLDARCNAVGSSEDVLVFTFSGCGCVCGDEVELSALNPPVIYGESTNPADAKSCPYLYAWRDDELHWQNYGKIIRDARGKNLEMTEAVKLSHLSFKFKLAEREPEQSFIQRVSLRLELKDGSQLILKPKTKLTMRRNENHIFIPAFGLAEFEFEPPKWLASSDVSEAFLSVTGYYETLPGASMCPVPNIASGQ
jgi:hypothetical protein